MVLTPARRVRDPGEPHAATAGLELLEVVEVCLGAHPTPAAALG
jgi:hypothetical protein